MSRGNVDKLQAQLCNNCPNFSECEEDYKVEVIKDVEEQPKLAYVVTSSEIDFFDEELVKQVERMIMGDLVATTLNKYKRTLHPARKLNNE